MLLITPSERAALRLLAEGETTSGISSSLGISESDLDALLTALFTRMRVSGRQEAVTNAVRRGLLSAGSPPGRSGQIDRQPDADRAILAVGASP